MSKITYSLFFMLFLFCSACQSNHSDNTSAPTEASSSEHIFKDLSVEDCKKMMAAQPSISIIDLRTPKETAKGMIPKAQHLDFYHPQFKEQLQQLDTQKPYLVYCASGGRSSKASKLMKKMGFKEVYNMLGGYGAFER